MPSCNAFAHSQSQLRTMQVAELEAKLADAAGRRSAAEQQVGFRALCLCHEHVISLPLFNSLSGTPSGARVEGFGVAQCGMLCTVATMLTG